MPNLIDVPSAAQRLDVSVSTIYRYIQRQRLRGFRKGGILYVSVKQLDSVKFKRICRECHKVFETLWPHQEFHERKCQVRYNVRNWTRRQKRLGRR